MNKQNKASRLPMHFFKEPMTGNIPVRDWLKTLTKQETQIIGRNLMFVQFNWPLGKPLVGHLGDGLWELRAKLGNKIARVIFIFRDDAIILLHGFIKKTEKIPQQDKRIALTRQKSYDFHGDCFQ